MSVIFLLIPLSVVVATGFLLAFIWAVRSGQYEDTCTPAMRMLLHDGVRPHQTQPSPSRRHPRKQEPAARPETRSPQPRPQSEL